MRNQAITQESIVRRDSNILTNTIDDQIVMMSLEKGHYYGMNPVGSRIWERLREPASVDALCDELLQEYQTDRQRCLHAVIAFLEKLHAAGLIEIVTSAG